MPSTRKHLFLALTFFVVLAACGAAVAANDPPELTLNIVGGSVANGTVNDAVRLDIDLTNATEGVVKLVYTHGGTGRVEIWKTDKSAKKDGAGTEEDPIIVNVTNGHAELWVRGTATSSVVPDVTITGKLWTDGQLRDTKTDTVTVVEVDRVQYQSGANWPNIIGPLYVLQGTTLTFKPIAKPSSASWPSGKPAWGGTAGAQGTGDTKAVTFNALGHKTVTANCGNTVTVDVYVKSLIVEFSKSEVRPGSTGAARAETVTATAKRAEGGDAVTISLSSSHARATVAPATFQLPAEQTEAQTTVTVTGTAESGADRDTTLLAKVAADTKGSIPITVTTPTNYWIRPSMTSGAWTIKPGTNVVIWSVACDIVVKDKWWKALGPAWEGAHVQEKVKNPGQDWGGLVGLDTELLPQEWSPLGANGDVNDMIRAEINGLSAEDAAAIVAGTKKFPKDFPPNPNPIVVTFELKFFVDEIELTGITNRTRTIQDNKETTTNQQ